MSRTIVLLLVFWNVVLSILLGLLLMRGSGAADTIAVEQEAGPAEVGTDRPAMPVDTLPRPDARIAYFMMDSVQERYTLVKESAERVRAEGRRLENELGRELQRAQARAQELMNKDHTYSTQAQLQADQEEYQALERKIQELRMTSQDRIDQLQIDMLNQIGKEIEEFLKGYNENAGFDYIFSIQDGGQIWVGNDRLDITRDVVDGLNDREKARKAATK